MSLKPLIPSAVVAALLMVGPGCGAGDGASPNADDGSGALAASFDLEAIAHTVVTRSAAVQEGEMVLISGEPRDLEFLENLAVHVRRVGAYPLILIGSDRLARRMWDDVPEELDHQRAEWAWALAEKVDVSIDVGGAEDPALLAHVPAERLAARARANEGLNTLRRERGTRHVAVGNAVYPTAARAEELGVERGELERLFWEGVTADPDELASIGNRLRAILEQASTVTVTHPNGTNLTVGIRGATVSVSDGRTVPDGGEADRWAWLPAGEVYLTVEAGSAEGRLVVDRIHFEGERVEGLELVFSGGQLQSMDADSEFRRLQEYYETAPPGADRLTVIDIGINPGITSQRILSFMTAGMFTAFMGDDTWAGGDLEVPWGLGLHQPGATILVDDRVVVEDGVLRL